MPACMRACLPACLLCVSENGRMNDDDGDDPPPPPPTPPLHHAEEHLGFAEKPDYIEVKATATWYKNDPEPWYKSCTSPDCKRKVTDQLGSYYCEKCQRSMQDCAYRCVRSFYKVCLGFMSRGLSVCSDIGRTLFLTYLNHTQPYPIAHRTAQLHPLHQLHRRLGQLLHHGLRRRGLRGPGQVRRGAQQLQDPGCVPACVKACMHPCRRVMFSSCLLACLPISVATDQ